MSFDLTGTLIEKFDAIQRSATFKVREFVIEHSRDAGGKAIVNYIKFQSTQDRTDLIEKFSKGDQIRVYFNVRGSRWEKNGQVSYFNNLEAWKVEYAMAPSTSGEPAEYSTPQQDLTSSADEDELPF